ncbi:MAG: NUDIX domain-containing protein [Candidatus Nanohalobium sp.]
MEFEPGYCPYCGEELGEKHAEDRERLYCPGCDRIIWRNAEPVAATVVTKGEKLLFVKRGIEPGKGKWSIPAGFLEYREDPDHAAARELEEETGLKVSEEDLQILDSFNMERFPGQRLLSVIYTVDAEKTSGAISAGDDAQEASFWSLEELQALDEEMRHHFLPVIQEALRENE